MSQTAETARDWINNSTPSTDQLKNAATALQRKLQDHPSLDDETRQNLTAALQVVAEELQAQQYAKDDEILAAAELDIEAETAPLSIEDSSLSTGLESGLDVTVGLDNSPLGINAEPIKILHGDDKKAAIAALREKIKF